jgi:hypothetical protein
MYIRDIKPKPIPRRLQSATYRSFHDWLPVNGPMTVKLPRVYADLRLLGPSAVRTKPEELLKNCGLKLWRALFY